MSEEPLEPSYADPERYVELVGFKGTWRDLYYNADFLGLMAHRWQLRNVHDALDVGCGGGHWTRTVTSLLPPDANMTGVDLEPHFLELAKKEGEARGFAERMHFVQGDATALPFEDASFDMVTSQLVLIHVHDLDAALREMVRVLRPGGLLAVAEPDNIAGNLALMRDSARGSDDELLTLMSLLQTAERGKLALGEGDQSVGPRLPGLFAREGLDDVRAYTNDRCIYMYPPHDAAHMKTALETELPWIDEDVSFLLGARPDVRRHYLAGGGSEAAFDEAWAAMRRYLEEIRRQVDAGTYAAARGFVMYLVSGRKPASS